MQRQARISGLCGEISPDGKWICAKQPGHEGNHGDERWPGVSADTEALWRGGPDPKAQAAAERLRGLVGRKLERIEVGPLGVMFHFSAKEGLDHGVVYWAYGGPKP
jgi:hypothetical protein